MTRLLLVVSLLLWAVPVSAQNWIVQNGVNVATCSSANPCVVIDQKGSGNLLVLRRNGVDVWALDFSGGQSLTGIFTVTNSGLGTTSTDGLVVQNATLATSGTTVQISPRIWQGGTAWDTAASKKVSFFTEVLPATAATPTGTWKLGYILEGVAATYPMTVTSGGTLTLAGPVSSAGGFIGGGDVQLGDPNALYWNTRSVFQSPANGQVNISNRAVTAGVGLDVTADALLKVRTRAQTGYATVDALGYLAQQASITAGAHATVVNTGEIRGTVVYKATVTATTCLAPFAAAATTADCVVATLPAKTKITAVYADTTAGWTCSGTCTGTKVLALGKSAGGVEYLASQTIATNPVMYGLADADLGTELVAAARIQGGAVMNWTGTTTVTARYTSGTGNWGDSATTYVDAGSTTFYIETTLYP